MRYLHTMVRVRAMDESLDFYCNKLGLVEMRRKDVPEGRFTLIFLAACLLYTSPSPRDVEESRMPSSA